jgi:hypothetical protein
LPEQVLQLREERSREEQDWLFWRLGQSVGLSVLSPWEL